jgi:hypothetical protein
MKKEEIQAWLDGPRDYETGYRLLEKYLTNRSMIRALSRRRDDIARQKLAYELVKIAGFPERRAYEKQVSVHHAAPMKNETVQHRPAVVDRAKIIRERGVLWKRIYEIGMENTYEKIKESFDILNKVKELSKKIASLSAKIKGLPEDEDKVEDPVAPSNPTDTLPEKVVTPYEVLKLHQNYENKISRRSQLKSKLNGNSIRGVVPMPAGKKRDKKVMQLQIVNDEIEALKQKLAEYEETTGS